MYNTILYDEKDSVATVTLNRPEFGNAFSEETYAEIIDVMDKIDQKDHVHAVVLTGAGKYFCSGGDVRLFQEMIDKGIEVSEEAVITTGRMVKSIKQNSKPVVAAINGFAAGAGLGLALACDFVVMGESTQLVTAFINMGFPGDTGLIYSLQQAIGTFRTTRHIMLNEPIDAKLATEYGIAYAVVKDEEIFGAATQLAQNLASGPTEAMGYQKALLAEMFYPGIDEVNEKEAVFMNKSSKSSDHKEAVDAFLNKRQPKFK